MPSVDRIPGIALANGRLIAVVAWLDGRPYRLVVDTGATHIALLPAIITSDLRLRRLPYPMQQTAAGQVQSQPVSVFHLDEAVVGPFAIPDLEVISLGMGRFSIDGLLLDGLLGMNWLEAFSPICLDLDTADLVLHHA